jgi:transcription elongation factor Elf1
MKGQAMTKEQKKPRRRRARKPKEQIIERQIIKRGVERCEKCGAQNSFRQTCGIRVVGNVRVAYAKCRDCGHRAQIRFNW